PPRATIRSRSRAMGLPRANNHHRFRGCKAPDLLMYPPPIEGMRCPRCKQEEAFYIGRTAALLAKSPRCTDNITLRRYGSGQITDACRCGDDTCNFEGSLNDFLDWEYWASMELLWAA